MKRSILFGTIGGALPRCARPFHLVAGQRLEAPSGILALALKPYQVAWLR